MQKDFWLFCLASIIYLLRISLFTLSLISSKEQLIKSKYSIPVSNFFKYNDKLSRLVKLTKLKLLSLDRITNSSLKKL